MKIMDGEKTPMRSNSIKEILMEKNNLKTRRSTIFYIRDESSTSRKITFRRASSVSSVEQKACDLHANFGNEELTRSLSENNKMRKSLSDDEIKEMISSNIITLSRIESLLKDFDRAVRIRRELIQLSMHILDKIPYKNYDYSIIYGACCENVIGYVPMPLGVAGPILINGKHYRVPLATTEGCLVASTNRGCRALSLSGGVTSIVISDGMTRGPMLRFPTAARAVEAMEWLSVEANFLSIKKSFDSTSRYARLNQIQPKVAGRYLFIRFVATTGDAMGMNMLSKGTEEAIKKLNEYFPDIDMNCLSGNFCVDKKPSAVNWVLGRGKSVVCEARVSATVVKEILKTTVKNLVDLNIGKNYIGSAMAGSIGGFNAQAANVVAAIFIATGQDCAQVVSSSNCITIIEACNDDDNEDPDLFISCTMPSIEVGTVGGGTVLTPQRGCLEMLQLGESPSLEFSQVVCGTVMAAELSLMSALSQGRLVQSHMKLNRPNSNN